MKKISTIIAIFFLISFSARADYNTPGTGKRWNLDSLVANSAGAVTFSGGEYFFTTNILVSQTDTLSIRNNATVKFSSLTLLSIFGTLIINPPDSVKFTTSDTAVKFVGIRLDSLADASVIRKLIMENANSIRLYDCNALIDSCFIRNNNYYASGLVRGAIYLFRSNPVISNNRIVRNGYSAITSGANIASSPTIINNLIYANDNTNYNVAQINLGAGGTSPVIIRNNTIIGLYTNSGGIAFLPVGAIPSLIIENNIIKNNRYGIALLAGGINAYINNNIIDSNNIQGSPTLGGSGLNFAGGWTTSSVIVTRNTVRWNLWGVTIQNTAKPNLGNLMNPDTTDDGNNIIWGNSNTGKVFDLFNNTPDTIRAENNFWGTMNLDTIESHIFHKTDSTVLGFVDYLPIRGPVTVSGQEIKIDSYEILDAYPNPFNPVVNINYHLKNTGKYLLRVFDILGNETVTLYYGDAVPGDYKIKWDASSYPSGIYFLRLENGGNFYTKKLVLLK